MNKRFDELNDILRRKFNKIGVDYLFEYHSKNIDHRFDEIQIRLVNKDNNRRILQSSFAGYYDYSIIQCNTLKESANMIYEDLMVDYGIELGIRKTTRRYKHK